MSTATMPQKTADEGPEVGQRWNAIRGHLQQLLALASLVVIFVFFSIASPYFLTYSNVTSILFATVVIGTLAVGVTATIITGGIDLSVGTGMTLTGVMSGVYIAWWGMPVWAGFIATILTGGLIGLVNGLNITFLKLPPFIATLAMMMAAQGLALVISSSAPIYIDDPGFAWISTGSIIPGVNFPNAIIVFVIAATIASIVLSRTIFGRYTVSIGSNEDATALSGINVRRWKIAIYAFAGLFTGLAGILISARLGSGNPAVGLGYELQAIAAAVIGGTSLSGGKGTITGTVIGALIISTLNNGLQIMAIPTEWQRVLLGVVIIFAVYMDQARRRGE